ncbi:hypothetical protein [Methanosphaerula palustris]|uniref:Uncharacterized protein n=1 Tax=Methanosphaerula palustris (strain ATCC BAA-1556 / DSM 19958 / E1-9c) TaxID=521011 RepID=B8GHX4_METPE|nr:hypothetical protein [Methanosphaerula palustris]ACL16714.1 hypothetical protein Mpal_1384 [Methanosphaerula palustris E1-9c]
MSTEIVEDTGAEPLFPYLRRHAIEHEAASRLRGLGYGVIRTDGRYPGVNLIAMKGDHFRFVCVRRRKKPAGILAQVAKVYAEDLYELRRYISSIVAADLWIWSTADRWRYFAVYPGGIQEIGENDASRL